MDSTSDHDPKPKIVMGYPSMDRYHGVQQQMYSSPPPPPPPYAAGPSFNHQYPTSNKYPAAPSPYAQPPYHHNTNIHPNYYNYQPSYKHLIPENDPSNFGRMMLSLMVVLVTSMCMMSLVMWFLFGTYIPEFEVVTLDVSNFTMGNETLSGIWNANLTVRNANHDLIVQFEQVRSSVFYKDVLLGLSSSQPFQVGGMQSYEAALSVPVDQNPNRSNNNYQKLQSWLMPTLEKDRANELVYFSLRLAMRANFTSPTLVYRRENMRVMCDDLPVQLLPSGEGKLTSGSSHPCIIRMRDTLEEDD